VSYEEALGYAARGWPVFPCHLPKKLPAIKDWGRAATTDRDAIRLWWKKWPTAVIALPTGARSGFVVLDVDTKNGVWGFDTLADLGRSILPDAPLAHTRSGGLHVYFACHPNVEIRNSAGAHGLGPGLDVRGQGGLVVLPSENSGYSWDPHWNFDTVLPPAAPAWLGHRHKPAATRPTLPIRFNPLAALRASSNQIRSAVDGEKHSILNREAFRVGTLVAAKLLPRNEAWRDLEAATAALIATSDADPNRTWKVLQTAFNDGRNAPRRASQ
jgi:hypothetical protein